MVTVSQAPAVSEAPSDAAPVVGGAPIATLPSAVQDLARCFLSLPGSSTLGAVGGVASVAASAAGLGVQLCPSTSAGAAVTVGAATAAPAGASGAPAASVAVPGVSGSQQHQESSRSRRRCRRSSSDGTDRWSKKRPRRSSSSPRTTSLRRERHYRSSSGSSRDERVVTSPLGAGRVPGGAPVDSRSAPAGDRSLRPGPSGLDITVVSTSGTFSSGCWSSIPRSFGSRG